MAVKGSAIGPERQPFKVIIIGAGVTGLTLSHALFAAKIQHVVLEKGVVAPEQGASIGIHSHGCRILHQLGCLDAIEKECIPMKHNVNRLPNGRVFSSSNFFDVIRRRNGYDFLNLERRVWLKTVFDQLPDQTVIKTRKRVIDITEHEDGVRVSLEDSTFEEGDVIIGCDGVNSIVRRAMWAHADKLSPGYITPAEKRTLLTTYTCLLGIAPAVVELGERDMTCVHDHGFSFLFLSQPKQIYFFVFSKLPQPIRWPDRNRWTDEDAEKVAARVAEHPVSESLRFGDLWRTRSRGQLVDLEEGVFEHWHFGRMALAGDAVHKVTSNFALGGNAGLESVAVLTNELHRLLRSNGKPDAHALTAMFQRYQAQRVRRIRYIAFVSALITRLQAWDGVLMYVVMRWVLPLCIGDGGIARELGRLSRRAPKLDFVEVEARRGSMGWSGDAEGRVATRRGEWGKMIKKKKGWRVSLNLARRPAMFVAGCLIVLMCSAVAAL